MADTKLCPYCGEDVKLEAIKCKHCQSMLSEEDNALVGAATPVRPQEEKPTEDKADSFFTGNSLKSWIIPAVVAAIILVYLFIGLDILDMVNGRNGDEPTAKPEEEKEELPVTYETLEEEVEAIIVSMLGEKTDTDKQRIVAVIHDEDEEGEYLQVMLNGNDYYTVGLTRTGLLMDTKELFEALYEIESDVTYISLFWALPLVDVYGNVNDRDVVIVSMDKETAAKVKWDNFSADNIPVIANSYWQHTALDKE